MTRLPLAITLTFLAIIGATTATWWMGWLASEPPEEKEYGDVPSPVRGEGR